MSSGPPCTDANGSSVIAMWSRSSGPVLAPGAMLALAAGAEAGAVGEAPEAVGPEVCAGWVEQPAMPNVTRTAIGHTRRRRARRGRERIGGIYARRRPAVPASARLARRGRLRARRSAPGARRERAPVQRVNPD